jgi:hypothetical protein
MFIKNFLVHYIQSSTQIGLVGGVVTCFHHNTNVFSAILGKNELVHPTPVETFKNVIGGAIVGFVSGPVIVPILPFYVMYSLYCKK